MKSQDEEWHVLFEMDLHFLIVTIFCKIAIIQIFFSEGIGQIHGHRRSQSSFSPRRMQEMGLRLLAMSI